MRLSETRGVCSQTEASSSIRKAWFGDCINSSTAARRYSQVLLLQTSGGHQAADFGSLPLFWVGVQGAGRGTELCYGREGGGMADLFMIRLWWGTSWETSGSILVYGRAEQKLSSHWIFPQHAATRQVCLGSCPLVGADRHSPARSSGWLSCCDFSPSNRVSASCQAGCKHVQESQATREGQMSTSPSLHQYCTILLLRAGCWGFFGKTPDRPSPRISWSNDKRQPEGSPLGSVSLALPTLAWTHSAEQHEAEPGPSTGWGLGC